MYECVAKEYYGLCINIFLLVYKNYIQSHSRQDKSRVQNN